MAKTAAKLQQELSAAQQKVRELEAQLQQARASEAPQSPPPPPRSYGGSGAGLKPTALKRPKTE